MTNTNTNTRRLVDAVAITSMHLSTQVFSVLCATLIKTDFRCDNFVVLKVGWVRGWKTGRSNKFCVFCPFSRTEYCPTPI